MYVVYDIATHDFFGISLIKNVVYQYYNTSRNTFSGVPNAYIIPPPTVLGAGVYSPVHDPESWRGGPDQIPRPSSTQV